MNPSIDIIKQIEKRYLNKSILILGFGKEGKSTYHLFKQLNVPIQLFIMDQNSDEVDDYLIKEVDEITRVISKDAYLQGLDNFDFIFKTPGLPGYLLEAVSMDKITSQSELFMEILGDRCIGITGTKGKSTTSSIIWHVFNGLGVDIRLVGNIGRPALESLLDDDGKRIYVYEMSSFQTEFLKIGPRFRVILNLFQEHLNNYKGYDEYQNSKLQLFKAEVLQEEPVFIYGCDNHQLIKKIKDIRTLKSKGRYFTFGHYLANSLNDNGCFIEENQIVYKCENDKYVVTSTDFSRELLGEHNLLNALVTYIIVDKFMSNQGKYHPNELFEKVTQLLSGFKGLPHRLQFVGEFKKVNFYNDSIATIPEAAIKGIESIEHLSTLIVGGYDRGIDYDEFCQRLYDEQDLMLICLPTTGHKIATKLLKMGIDTQRVFVVDTMEEAVEAAFQVTPKFKSCLLSPAASSYNQYKNFEERGNHYMELIKSSR